MNDLNTMKILEPVDTVERKTRMLEYKTCYVVLDTDINDWWAPTYMRRNSPSKKKSLWVSYSSTEATIKRHNKGVIPPNLIILECNIVPKLNKEDE